LRRASKRFWLLVNVVAVVVLAIQVGSHAERKGRVNELTLAGLRPAYDKISAPAKEFRDLTLDAAVTDAYVWGDICTQRELRVAADASGDGVVKTVTVGSNYKPEILPKCAASVLDTKRLKLIASGYGLQLGDARGRIEEIYGKTESRSPSVKGHYKLELYLYKFGWAGTDVPQVMEVSCDVCSQTVAEITLAAATL
jgi:hypothetical protein